MVCNRGIIYGYSHIWILFYIVVLNSSAEDIVTVNIGETIRLFFKVNFANKVHIISFKKNDESIGSYDHSNAFVNSKYRKRYDIVVEKDTGLWLHIKQIQPEDEALFTVTITYESIPEVKLQRHLKVKGNVQVEKVRFQENATLQWDIWNYSMIDYAYIKHERELIVTIWPLTHITIEDEFRSQVVVFIIEFVHIEMTIINFTAAANGIYTCTVGNNWERDLIIEKELSVIDPEIPLSIDTDIKDCKTLNCSSMYNVALMGPKKKNPDRVACLLKEDKKLNPFCLMDISMCRKTCCKYIDNRLDGHNNINQRGNAEITTPFTGLSYNLDQQNLDIIFFPMMSFIILTLLASLIVAMYVRAKCTSNSFEQTSYTVKKTRFTRFIPIHQMTLISVFSVMAITLLVLLVTIIVLIVLTKSATCKKREDRNQDTNLFFYNLVSCIILFLLIANIVFVLRTQNTKYKGGKRVVKEEREHKTKSPILNTLEETPTESIEIQIEEFL